MSDLIIFTDGACSGNPGPGGWAYLLYDDEIVCEGADHDPQTTNNRMELQAVLSAFSYAVQKVDLKKKSELKIYTDSVYVIRGSTQWLFGWKKRGWKTAENAEVSNQELWQEMDVALYQFKKNYPDLKISWHYVRGHTGIEGNEICDELAVKASHNDYLNLYRGPRGSYKSPLATLPTQTDLPDMKKKTSSGGSKKEWYISYVDGTFARHTTWSECERLVKGRKALFKKVASDEEEQAMKDKWGVR